MRAPLAERWALVVLTLATPGLAILYRSRLPARAASHFGPSGVPDRWASRDGFLLDLVAIAMVSLVVFLASARVAGWAGDEWINLPHKAFWLAPERRSQTLDRIERHVLKMGIATQILLLFVFQQTLSANASGAMRLSSLSSVALALYSAIMIGLLFLMIREFARPPAS